MTLPLLHLPTSLFPPFLPPLPPSPLPPGGKEQRQGGHRAQRREQQQQQQPFSNLLSSPFVRLCASHCHPSTPSTTRCSFPHLLLCDSSKSHPPVAGSDFGIPPPRLPGSPPSQV
ncbi:hypothetical protein CLOM_g10935 [Closterium sp. NIES-68]|nr:hypothetical protein CLOM_g10935 [Closterium sp. NIES-68]GJP57799.1 hypothetical protein CLOP_g17392 [Closterium sp. NIES-67]